MASWTVRSATLADRDAALRLMARAFGPDEDLAALWDWAFARNPFTSNLYYVVADAGDRLAGQYAALPVPVQYDGTTVLGLISVHTATDPDFRRQGIFRALAERLYEEASSSAPVVFGFPNENAAPGLYRHLGWVDLRPFPLLRRPLAINRADSPLASASGRVLRAFDRFAGARTGVQVEAVAEFDQRADALWERMRRRLGTAIVRDAKYLNWRFVSSPFRYRRYLALRGDEPVGLAVVADAISDRCAHLMELLVPGDDRPAVRALVSAAAADASARGAWVLRLIATRRHPNWRRLITCGFFPEPSAWLRLPTSPADSPQHSFGVRIIGPPLAPSRVLHIDDWHLSGADTDWL